MLWDKGEEVMWDNGVMLWGQKGVWGIKMGDGE